MKAPIHFKAGTQIRWIAWGAVITSVASLLGTLLIASNLPGMKLSWKH